MATSILPVTADQHNTPSHSVMHTMQVEDYPAGYPRYAALISSHPDFHVFRRFSAVRARLLLYKQDRLTVLEQQLADLDKKEKRELFRASFRMDENKDRRRLMGEIDNALSEYDDLMSRNEKALSMKSTSARHATSLKNWVKDDKNVFRDETTYLDYHSDLVAVGALTHDVPGVLQYFLEDIIIWVTKVLRKMLPVGPKQPTTTSTPDSSTPSRNPDIHLLPARALRNMVNCLLTVLLILLLFVPVMTVMRIANLEQRLAVIMVASAVFVILLSVLGKAKTADLFVAGATYSAVLVVFVTQS
ncbi:hypothetical protein B0T17DRAFT_618198 [Bombardia bombarda]|uniref:DUF6594 domain-containing protein n=1 Tax=Bombardia bombarda TaxID=252184 RepID=A0AA39WUI1_9PEZI|nr:hypothetical protein B0T17DRAFT_618198 [Bombardia bombarda]